MQSQVATVVKNPKYHYTAASIYPGIYQPVFTKEQEQLKIKGSKPPVNIIGFSDYYQIEMPAPGFRKEDFFIKTQGCSLVIVAYKKCCDATNEAHYHHHGFHCRYISRSVELPGDADTEFGTAEYKNGILYIYLYKTNYPVQNAQNFIIVY
ncbi:Hsp20/alpha crystallin family protein [Niastella caeni]|uniref:Hsp20/alpha crystallin family protein n=1 Tax=Niastella caeni TaxID=2569763 RepID=A0A4S8HVV0_9BACT|nr:Hsp20/alpha crystallin family protein [Niastella caeni]THU39545.1 Hsp20/alpha crystallin family protein [Niastella caeni]